MDNIISLFGIEIDADLITDEALSEIESTLDVYASDNIIYIGLSPSEMDDDDTLYNFKERIVSVLVDYLPYITEEDINFITRLA